MLSSAHKSLQFVQKHMYANYILHNIYFSLYLSRMSVTIRQGSRPMRMTGDSQAIFSKCHDVAETFRSLSHPARLKILCCLLEGPRNVGALVVSCKMDQAPLSQFLSRMKKDSLLSSERSGQQVFYKIADRRLFKLLSSVRDVYCS
jgi:DNA-binding transcriptional ArsR family regulator